jgi:predicted nucleotidyltransferase component of viral defense system
MIQPKEISKYAGLNKVSDRQIEKDYILSWTLYGISQHEVLKQILAFKGGTVLKKCYFEDYRFSEDLDFTLLDDTHDHNMLKGYLDEVFEWVKEEANIVLTHKEDSIHDKSGSSQFYVNYVGPLGGNLGSRDIKIDITRGEKLEFDLVSKKVFKTYSDLPEESFELLCYSLSEVLIEKMAALMGRTEPRDMYDFWYLMEIERMEIKDHDIEFRSKAAHKNQNPDEFGEKVMKKEAVFKRDWVTKLENQVHDIPKFDNIFREVKRYLK